MKYRDRLLRAAINLVDRNRRAADREKPIVGDLDFLAAVDAVLEEIGPALTATDRRLLRYRLTRAEAGKVTADELLSVLREARIALED